MSSTSTRTFEFKDDKSSRFWEITQAGSTVTVRYGKTGTNGQTQEKVFADAAAASKHVEKLIAEKTGKGYLERGGAPSASVATVVTSDASAELVARPATKPKASRSAETKPSKPKSPAQDPEATPESLMALLDKDDTTNRLLAKHPQATGELLEKLSHSSDQSTRKGVAGNPNTAPETLVRLGQQFPQEFLANPALDLLLIVNPALMKEVPDAFLIRVLKQAECPESLLTWAAGEGSAKVQLAVAMNPKAPEDALEKLRQSYDAAVREAVQARTSADTVQDPEKGFEQAVMDRLASMSSYELRESWRSGDIGLAQWAALPLTYRLAKTINSDDFPPSAIARMLNESNWTLGSLRKALPGYDAWKDVFVNPKMPVHLLESLVGDAYFRGAVATNPSTPVAVLGVLAKDKNSYIRRIVARNPSTSVAILEAFAQDKDRDVRRSVAANPSTSALTLDLLSQDKDVEVRRSVARHLSTPTSVLDVLTRDSNVLVRCLVAMHVATSAAALEALALDKDQAVRWSVARHPSTSAPVLESLAQDKNNAVRYSVASNSSTAVAVLEELVKDKNKQVRQQALLNYSLRDPQSGLSTQDKDISVRRSVAISLSTSASLLGTLSQDKNADVRKAVAAHPATPPSVLEKLAKDRVGQVVLAVVGNLNTPLSVLNPLIESKTVRVREKLARQAHRSLDICRALWKDANDSVREALIQNQQLDGQILDELARNAELEKDCAALLMHPNLSAASVQLLADRLLTTPATASPWYLDELGKASNEVRAAVHSGSVLSYSGEDLNKAVLAQRAIAPVMALCAGPFVEPSRIVKVVGSTDWLVRAAAARNPGTPPNLLKKLSADAHPLVAVLARTTLRKDEGARAGDHEQPAEGLDPRRATQEILGRIPNTGMKELFEGLSKFFTDDVWCDQLTVGQISWLTAALVKTQFEVLPFAEFPPLQRSLDPEQAALMVETAVAFEKGLGTVDSYVRMWAAEEPASPVHVLRSLADDADPVIVLAAMGNPAFPPEEEEPARQRLLKLRGKQLLVLLENKAAPSEMLEAKSTSKDIDVRKAIAANPSTPVHVLEALAKDSDEWIRRCVAENSSTPVALLEALAKNKEIHIRKSIAENPSNPIAIRKALLEALAKVSDVWVRQSVAKNTSTPVSVLEALAKDSDGSVRQSVAENPSTPITIRKVLLEALVKDSDVYYRQSVAGKPSTPVSVLEALAKDSEGRVRGSVARNPSAPVAMLEALVKDSDWWVRQSVAGNPSTPVSVLEALAKDSDGSVRQSVAGNPSTHVSVLEALAKDSYPSVRKSVAKSTSTPVSVLEALAKDSVWWIRQSVAENPSAPVSILISLAEDASVEVRVSLLRNPTSPADLRARFLNWWLARLQRSIQRELGIHQGLLVAEPRRSVRPADLSRALDRLGLVFLIGENEALTKASRSKDWLTRFGVALHPSATEGILKLLRQDSDLDVARAAAIDRALISGLKTG